MTYVVFIGFIIAFIGQHCFVQALMSHYIGLDNADSLQAELCPSQLIILILLLLLIIIIIVIIKIIIIILMIVVIVVVIVIIAVIVIVIVAATFIPMPMPKPVCRTSLSNKWAQYEVL